MSTVIGYLMSKSKANGLLQFIAKNLARPFVYICPATVSLKDKFKKLKFINIIYSFFDICNWTDGRLWRPPGSSSCVQNAVELPIRLFCCAVSMFLPNWRRRLCRHGPMSTRRAPYTCTHARTHGHFELVIGELLH